MVVPVSMRTKVVERITHKPRYIPTLLFLETRLHALEKKTVDPDAPYLLILVPTTLVCVLLGTTVPNYFCSQVH